MKRLMSLIALTAITGLVALSCGDRVSPVSGGAEQAGLRAAKPAGRTWLVPGNFATIQQAVNSPSVSPGDRIMVGTGSHAGALLSKAVEIKGEDGAVISSGPVHGSGLIQGFRLLAGSGGSILSHLTFTTDLSIMNGAAVSDVKVTLCTFTNPVQAVSNWAGNRWEISHNRIEDLRTRCGGGIGILVGDRFGGTVEGNVVSHNKVSGQVHVSPTDCGGYNASGIVLYADFRWGMAGTKAMKSNRVVQNAIGLTMDDPRLPGMGDPMDVVAFELTDSRDNGSLSPVIFGNAIGFNDFRDTALQIALTPANLDACNDISRNLGENRGHGLHPSLFGPGGN